MPQFKQTAHLLCSLNARGVVVNDLHHAEDLKGSSSRRGGAALIRMKAFLGNFAACLFV